MCTIAIAKVQRYYNCYNVYFNECLLPNVGTILLPKLGTVLTQGIWINVIHTVVLYQDAIVAIHI